MNKKVYLHCLVSSRIGYNSKSSLKKLDEILKSGALESAKQRGVSCYNFCGNDYISLVDYEKRFNTKQNDYNGYNQYVKFDASIIFPKGKFDVVEPIILEHKLDKYQNYISLMQVLGEDKENRYSDLIDEVQVKDSLSLSYMNGIALPSLELLNFWKSDKENIKKLKQEVLKYKELLDKYGYSVGFYDSDTLLDLEKDENIEDLVGSYRTTKSFLKR